MISYEENKERGEFAKDLEPLVRKLNYVLMEWAKKGVHPPTMIVFPPGSNYYGDIFDSYWLVCDAFRPTKN